ncbi:hypothetical protein [Xanthomonas melonis]|uniref:hypothetical protein n=1 Tax=Xanthomonas melonis TaxID=56456 RepID=UPI001E37F7C2|nr:hypothetical protein [Xanthomonas melonis]MCD0244473.1 hypothetical protein [Xanthomonas melonis]
MSSAEVRLWFYAKPKRDLTIEQRHAEVMGRMSNIKSPLGFKGLDLPPAPSCGNGLAASYKVKLPVKGLLFFGDYVYRGGNFACEDRASCDEHLRYGFKVSNPDIDYKNLLNNSFCEVVEAFGSYKAIASYGFHMINYHGNGSSENPIYARLSQNKSVDVDGRNNIFTLHPAQFWDAELCNRALGYGPDEVVAKLQGKVQRVERFLDGVFLLLNDDPDLSYEEFVSINECVKPILGLI